MQTRQLPARRLIVGDRIKWRGAMFAVAAVEPLPHAAGRVSVRLVNPDTLEDRTHRMRLDAAVQVVAAN